MAGVAIELEDEEMDYALDGVDVGGLSVDR